MWIKNLFTNTNIKQQQLKKKLTQQQYRQTTIFEIQDQFDEDTSPLIDQSPDLRYNNNVIISYDKLQSQQQHMMNKAKMIFPSHIINSTSQTILLCNINNNQTDSFYCRSIHQPNPIQVKLICTDKQLVISPNIYATQQSIVTMYLDIPLGEIQRIQMKQQKKQVLRLHLILKDGRQMMFSNKNIQMMRVFEERLGKFVLVNGINKFFAFQYRRKWGKDEEVVYKGWQVYSVRKEYMRQGVWKHVSISSKEDSFKYAYKLVKNYLFQLSPTYPDEFIVPFNISKQGLSKAAKFRTRGRLPALTYYYQYKPQSYSTLFRCSQIRTGVMGNRCEEDENIVKQIAQSSNFISKRKKIYQKHNVKIYDARGYYAALGNMLAGKGYEKQQTYNCDVQFLNIPNIHAVRDSYTITKSANHQTTNLYQLMIKSNWLQYISLILKGAKEMAVDMMAGKNVLVHCSDGWDRTAQLSSLCQVLLDPYYRTIEGLAVLIEKDWRAFGHKFRQRTGQYHPTSYHPSQKSPVFIQFLDCIYQLQSQFPMTFQYNSSLLQFLAKHVNSCVYGTFLTNNIKQANQIKVESQTVSIWTDVMFSDLKEEFINPFFKQVVNHGFLDVNVQTKSLSMWKEHLFYRNGNSQVSIFALEKKKILINALKEQKEQLLLNQKKTINDGVKGQSENENTVPS